tara:strand:- start:334 stop:549 length:216 start_codon:yes stop_codon:yes gene_type:complete
MEEDDLSSHALATRRDLATAATPRRAAAPSRLQSAHAIAGVERDHIAARQRDGVRAVRREVVLKVPGVLVQ